MPWLQIVTLVAFLVLAIAGLRSQGISASKGVRMALIWIAIFGIAALIASMFLGDELPLSATIPAGNAPSHLT